MFKNTKDVYDYVISEVVRICEQNPHIHSNVRSLYTRRDSIDCDVYDNSTDATFTVAVSNDVYRMMNNERMTVCGGLEGNKETLTLGGRPLIVVNNRTQYVNVFIEY